MTKMLIQKDMTESQAVEENKRNTCCSNTVKVSSPLRVMDHSNLSLGPSKPQVDINYSFSYQTEESNGKKRKLAGWEEPSTQNGIDFHINDPLPLDWEQCLDLQSGCMYYVNRKTLKKTLARPKEQNIDLELNISTLPVSENCKKSSSLTFMKANKQSSSGGGGHNRMVAVVCFNCHLLVMVYRSSPSCPNCKYLHSLPSSSPQKMKAVQSFDTLSLLH